MLLVVSFTNDKKMLISYWFFDAACNFNTFGNKNIKYMRKLLLSLIAFVIVSMTYAQVTFISEGFETFPFPPTGWSGDIGVSPSWEKTNFNPHSGSYTAQAGLGVLDPVEASLITPVIDLSQSSSKQLTFWYRYAYEAGGNTDSTYVEISSNGGAWQLLRKIKATATNSDTWTLETIDLTAYAQNTFKIRWRYVGEGMTAWQVQIDDIFIGASIPGGLVANGMINQASVALSWQHPGATEYKIYRSEDSLTFNYLASSATNTYNDNTVLFNKKYFYRVTAVYSTSETDKSGIAKVYIPGGDIVWLDDFESGTINNQYTLMDVDGALAWVSKNYDTFEDTFEAFAWRIRSSQDETNFACHSGTHVIGTGYNQNGTANNDWIVLPQINVEDTTYRFGFYAVSSDATLKESFQAMVSTEGNVVADFTPIYSLSQVPGKPNWGFYQFSLKNYAGQNIYLAIKCNSVDKYVLLVDDIFVFKTISTNISQTSIAPSITCYPNPTNNNFTIDFGKQIESNTFLQIVNSTGQTVESRLIEIGEQTTEFNNLTLPAGIYFIQLKSSKKQQVLKLVIQ